MGDDTRNDDRQGAFCGWRAFASQLDWALAYSRFGLFVFPVKANKKPIVLHWREDATRDPAIIEGWWRKHPHADVAVALDADTVVADADVSHGQRGFADIERLAGMTIDNLAARISISVRQGAATVMSAFQERRSTSKARAATS